MLTPQQRAKLKAAGYSDTKINVFEAQKALKEEAVVPEEPTFLGKVVRETARPLANVATSVVHAGQKLGDVFTGDDSKEINPLSGSYLGEVDGLGEVDITKSPLDKDNLKVVKKAVKAGVDIGTMIAGGGGAGSVAKTGIKEGIKQGIKAGAKAGATVGAVGGASTGLEDGATLKDTLINTAIGTAGGAVVGGVLGGASGAVGGAKKAVTGATEKGKTLVNKIANKPTNEADFALDFVAPKATDKVKQAAIAQGRVSEQGWIRPSKILPSNRDKQLADSVKGVVSMKKSVPQNVDALDTTIGKINNEVKSYVKKNKVPFNTKQLTSQLNKGKKELNVIFASDTNAEKTYNAVVKEFIKHVKSKDTAGLLDARQAVDNIPSIKKLLDSQGLAENVKKEVVLTLRRRANQYVSDLLPKGNRYKADMLREHHMLEVLGNIASKESKEIGLNKIQSLTAKYPLLKWIVGAGSVAAGGAVIGSLD